MGESDDLDERRMKKGPKPTGRPDVDFTGKPNRRPPPPTGEPDEDKRRMRKGPKPTGKPDEDFTGKPNRRPPPTGEPDEDKRGMTGPPPSGKPPGKDEFDPVGALLKICEGLVKMAEKEEADDDKRSIDMVLDGMKDVCLAAFEEAKADAEE